MDKSSWQTLGSFDFLHSSRKWLHTVLSCGQHSSALPTGFIPRLRFCWRPWRLKINFGWTLMSEWWGFTLRTKRSCACDCGTGPVSVGAFFFLLSFFFSHLESCRKIRFCLFYGEQGSPGRGEMKNMKKHVKRRKNEKQKLWATQLSIADWVYSKTQTFLATLRTRNQLREESYAFSGVTRSCQ